MAEPRITIVGAGPVGTLLAASLLHNGSACTWVVRSPQRRAQLDPLKLFADGVPYRLNTAGLSIVPQLEPVLADTDWLVLAVKAQQVAGVLTQAAAFPRERVLVVANGLHAGPFHFGALYGGGRLDDSGALVLAGPSTLRLGPLALPGSGAAELEALAPRLGWPMLRVIVQPEIALTMWNKAALNCVINPLTALLDCENGALLPLLDSPLVRGMLAEAVAVMQARGLALPREPLQWLAAELRALVEATAANSSSMREDLRAGRETEIACLNAALAEAGAGLGLSCPLNAELARMVSYLANRGAL